VPGSEDKLLETETDGRRQSQKKTANNKEDDIRKREGQGNDVVLPPAAQNTRTRPCPAQVLSDNKHKPLWHAFVVGKNIVLPLEIIYRLILLKYPHTVPILGQDKDEDEDLPPLIPGLPIHHHHHPADSSLFKNLPGKILFNRSPKSSTLTRKIPYRHRGLLHVQRKL
jgi:hypothetical protein